MIFWNSINEGHRKILSIMHTNGSCIASTYHTYQHYIVSVYSLYSATCVWICFSFIFQQFYGVFFTHDQIECTLTKWTQRMTVMKWSFVFLLFGCVHCLLALNPWLISYCYFFVVHLMGDILNGTWADPMVDRHIQCACKRKYLPIVRMCVCFFYLLPSHEASERRTRLQNDAYSTYANTKHIHNILCAHCSLDSYHTVPSNCFDAIIFVVGSYLLYHTNRLKFHFSALLYYTYSVHTYWNTPMCLYMSVNEKR